MTDHTLIALTNHLDHVLDDLGLEDECAESCSTTPLTQPASTARTDKLKYLTPAPSDLAILTGDLKSAISEGCGEAIVQVGLGDDGSHGITAQEMELSLTTLNLCAQHCHAASTLLRQRVDDSGLTADVLVRQTPSDSDFIDVRVAVCGNVDAGKSTLLGVLTHGQLDNGRGKSRAAIFRHKHEVDTGRTSCVSTDILGFDEHGHVTNAPNHDGSLDWPAICAGSAKVVSFIDLAGHEKYLKTTVFGLTGHLPDYVMLMVGANAGIVGMTKEHLGLALALNVPVFIVITKVDMCPPNILAMTVKLLTKLLKSPGCRKLPVMITSQEDVLVAASNFKSERVCPIFQVSNVTGEHIDTLKSFINLLSPRLPFNEHLPAQFQIDDTFTVAGVGAVVGGTMLQGTIHINDTLMLGPDKHGEFVQTTVKSICRRRLPTTAVRGGQTATLSLKKIKRGALRKGMALVAPALKPSATLEFEADVIVLHHPTTMTSKYQAMVHCGTVRQTACIVHMGVEHLRSGDHTSVVFRFMQHPEYMRVGSKVIFRDGRTKAVGTVTRLLPALGTTRSITAQAVDANAEVSSGLGATPLSNRQSRKLFYDEVRRTREACTAGTA